MELKKKYNTKICALNSYLPVDIQLNVERSFALTMAIVVVADIFRNRFIFMMVDSFKNFD